MSRRPPEQRLDGWRCVGDVLRGLVEQRPDLGIVLPDTPPNLPRASIPSPTKLSPEPPKVTSMNNEKTNEVVGNLRAAKLLGLAAALHLVSSATRGLVASVPKDLSALPHARLDAELERFRGQMLDWAAWFDERAEEAERAALGGDDT
jgi:hypothetical protein